MSEYAKGATGLGVNCSASVYRDGFFGSSSCSRWARIERDGKPYCKQHDPLKVAKKKKDKEARWRKEWDRKAAIAERRALEIKYCKGLTNDDLRKRIGDE